MFPALTRMDHHALCTDSRAFVTSPSSHIVFKNQAQGLRTEGPGSPQQMIPALGADFREGGTVVVYFSFTFIKIF